jgi:hypothetical protein
MTEFPRAFLLKEKIRRRRAEGDKKLRDSDRLILEAPVIVVPTSAEDAIAIGTVATRRGIHLPFPCVLFEVVSDDVRVTGGRPVRWYILATDQRRTYGYDRPAIGVAAYKEVDEGTYARFGFVLEYDPERDHLVSQATDDSMLSLSEERVQSQSELLLSILMWCASPAVSYDEPRR